MKRQQSVYENVNERMARACVRNTNVSYKHASEACAYIKGKTVAKAKAMLERVLNHENALPLRKFNKEGAGHKPGKVGPGRFPEKTVSAIHDLLLNVQVNAKQKGLDSENAKIIHLCAHKGANQPRYGRSKRGIMKRCNMEIIVEDTSLRKERQKTEEKESAQPKETAQQQPQQQEGASSPAEEEEKQTPVSETAGTTTKKKAAQGTKKKGQTQYSKNTAASQGKSQSKKKSSPSSSSQAKSTKKAKKSASTE